MTSPPPQRLSIAFAIGADAPDQNGIAHLEAARVVDVEPARAGRRVQIRDRRARRQQQPARRSADFQYVSLCRASCEQDRSVFAAALAAEDYAARADNERRSHLEPAALEQDCAANAIRILRHRRHPVDRRLDARAVVSLAWLDGDARLHVRQRDATAAVTGVRKIEWAIALEIGRVP